MRHTDVHRYTAVAFPITSARRTPRREAKLPGVEQPTGSEAVVATVPAENGAPFITRLMFLPVKLASRRVAPRLASELFGSVWRVVDDSEPPPRPEDRQRSVGRLAFALALEGACSAVVRGLLDQASRRQFARFTGRWPDRPTKP